MARSYFIETFGCQMNYHDSERAAGLLEAAGYAPASSAESADVVVINTCSVRERAEEKLYTRLGELREHTREQLVTVMGCVAQQEGESLLKRDSSIDVIVGTQSLKQLPELVGRSIDRRRAAIDIAPHEDPSFPLGLVKHSDQWPIP